MYMLSAYAAGTKGRCPLDSHAYAASTRGRCPLDSCAYAAGTRGRCPLDSCAYAAGTRGRCPLDSRRALPCTRWGLSPRPQAADAAFLRYGGDGGFGAFKFSCCVLPSPPKGRRAGWYHAE